MHNIFFRFSLRTQLLAVFLVLFGASLSLTVFLSTRIYHKVLDYSTSSVEAEVQATTRTLVEHLDPKLVLTVSATGVMNTPDYDRLESQLAAARSFYPKITAARIFARDPQHPATLWWVATGSAHPACNCNVTRLVYQPSLEDSNLVFPAFDHPTESQIYSVPSGAQISSFVPIQDSSGRAVGILGIYLSVQGEINIQNDVRRESIVILLVELVMLLGVIPLSGLITTRLRTVADGARALARGTAPDRESLDRVGRGGDEISALAHTFIAMAIEVQKREQQLKQQVHELRIEVDIVKQAQQVSEITDTDFFQDLQQRARQMREAKSDYARHPHG